MEVLVTGGMKEGVSRLRERVRGRIRHENASCDWP